MHEVTTVFFDAGGTLLKPREDVGEVYARSGRRHGIDAEPHDLMASFLRAFSRRKLDGRPQDKAWWRGVVEEAFAPFGGGDDPAGLFEDLYGHFTHPDAWELFPRAHEIIRTLKTRGYRTALISNWDERLPKLLEELDLASLLDPIVISCRVGAEKPHPRIFETALEEADVPPSTALMVGDDYEADVEGARAMGMKAVLVRRPGQTSGNGAVAIDRLEDLLDLLPDRRAQSG